MGTYFCHFKILLLKVHKFEHWRPTVQMYGKRADDATREKKEIERKPSTDFEILLMTDG
jgi:hypothetical protein